MRASCHAWVVAILKATLGGFLLLASLGGHHSFISIAAPARADTTDPDGHPRLEFKRIVLNTNGDSQEICLRFSEALNPSSDAHYSDYVRIEPVVAVAFRVADKDLCLGGLASGTNYKMTLLKDLPALAGTRLDQDEPVDVSLDDRPPHVAISGGGFILARAASNGLAIETVNVDRIKVRVLRMGDRALPAHLYQYGGFFQELRGKKPYEGRPPILSIEQMQRYQLRGLLQQSATLIWSGTMDVTTDHNRTVSTAFPLASVVKPGQSGAYLVIAEDAATATPDSFFTQLADPTGPDGQEGFRLLFESVPAHWVIATDLALTAITGSDGLHVSVRSLVTAEPVPNIDVALIATDQDVLGESKTDTQGMAVFAPGLLRGEWASAPDSIVAHGADGDFNILSINRPAFDLSDRGVGGRSAAGAIEAFVYLDRGTYRPGETLHAMALLRDQRGNAVAGTPLTLVLRRPDGVEARRFALDPAALGGFNQTVELSDAAPRGLWSIEAFVDPAGKPVGRATFDVQDFVPEQLAVTAKSNIPVLTPSDQLSIEVDGRFLYGAPAAGLQGTGSMKIEPDPVPFPDAKGYRFGLVDEKVDQATQELEVPAADDNGHIDLQHAVAIPANTTVPLRAEIDVGLIEPSGRVVQDHLAIPIRAHPVLIGIHPLFADDRVPLDGSAAFDVQAFDEEGHSKPVDGVNWTLIRENRVFDWFEMGNVWTWHYHVVDETVESGTIDLAGSVPGQFHHAINWGFYRLIMADPASGATTSVRFEKGWEASDQVAETPDKVDVSFEKKSFSPGESVHLHIKGPFAGRAEINVAADRVFESRTIDVPAEGTSVDLQASEAWGAGAYAMVTMYRPLASGRPHDPVRAIGVTWMPIDAAPKTIDVALDAPAKVLPRQPIEVSVHIGHAMGPVYVTLAAVDEGILQLTKFASPDPEGFLFGQRAIGVDIRDDYGRLLDGSAEAGPIREGGDKAARQLGGAGLAVTSTRSVALFSGPVAVDSDGVAKVVLEVPDFEGELRLMAIAYSGTGVGHASSRLTVRDPLVADLALPRFLAPGDSAQLAISVQNADGPSGQYHLDLSVDGSAGLSADHPLDFALAPGERRQDTVTVTASKIGVAKVGMNVSGPDGYRLHRDWQVAVRPAHYPITLAVSAAQSAGESFKLDPAMLDTFLPDSATISLGYSSIVGIDVPGLLQSLYQYPFGCTEQQVSVAYPLIYFNDPKLLGKVPLDKGLKDRVQRAINTIVDRQDASGEFGLWAAGDKEASAWLNVYALDFLARAKEAGFSVSDSTLRAGYSWLQQAIRNGDAPNAGAYADTPQATAAYAQYVLARSARADIGELRRLADGIQADLPGNAQPAAAHSFVSWPGRLRNNVAEPLSLGQVAGALALMGDRARSHRALDAAIDNLDYTDYPRWWLYRAYYSEARDLAGLIAITVEIGDEDATVRLLNRLQILSPAVDRLNTQDKAWLLAAAHALAKRGGNVILAVNGVEQATDLPAELAPSEAEIRSGYEVINNSDRTVWRTVIVQGSPKTAQGAMEAGFTLLKEFFDLSGKAVDPAHLRQNDRVIVSLRGESSDNNFHHAVLVDPLPAGWEIEATIEDDEDYDFLAPLSQPKIAERRDDRYVAAIDIGPQPGRNFRFKAQNDADKTLGEDEYHVAYLVRVVTPGSFVLPEASIEDMYKPGVMARSAAGTTGVDPR